MLPTASSSSAGPSALETLLSDSRVNQGVQIVSIWLTHQSRAMLPSTQTLQWKEQIFAGPSLLQGQ